MNRHLLLVFSFFALHCWAYVVDMQIAFKDADWDLVWWLPRLRLDYFGEVAFVIAFAYAVTWALSPEPSKRRRTQEVRMS